ncbi:rhomboid family intramembrane serine protease [Mesorhizobium sp. ASY16-5R]|uniref:rhomboid family intramembrane serine protease n=1 Tax=Mesorhizobium sp. ASY16-5R TaxID=3445772 RepID=UPI003FA068B6
MTNEQSPHDTPALPQNPPREPVFNIPGIVLLLVALCAAVHIIRVYLLTIDQDTALLLRTAFIPVRYSGIFEIDIYVFTAPFTYTFLHGGWLHLGINMIWLAVFGSPLANRIGVARFVLFWAVTGVAAAALHWAIHPLAQGPLIGASGAISGMMGAAARFAFRIERRGGRAAFGGPALPVALVLRSRTVVTFLAFWMIINLATGFYGFGPGADAAIAWEAHIGGFVAGFLGIPYFLGRRR